MVYMFVHTASAPASLRNLYVSIVAVLYMLITLSLELVECIHCNIEYRLRLALGISGHAVNNPYPPTGACVVLYRKSHTQCSDELALLYYAHHVPYTPCCNLRVRPDDHSVSKIPTKKCARKKNLLAARI
jgi:hypothetical protein